MLTNKEGKLNIKYLNKQDFQKTQDSYELGITSLGLSSEPDCYIIDGLTFEKQLSITGNYSGEIIIRNCYFFRGMTIHTNGVVTLENSKLTNYTALNLCSQKLVINNLIINNHPRLYGIELFIAVNEQFQIINSVLGSKHHSPCLYINKDLSLINAMIIGEEITCYTDSLISDDFSSIFATAKISLNTQKLSNIRITSQTFIYNDNLLFSDPNEETDCFIKDKHYIKIKQRRLN